MSWLKKAQKLPIVGALVKKIVAYKANQEAESIADHFIEFLRPEIAASEGLKKEVFNIRHNVYCEELAFEEENEEQQEMDEFDQQALFTVLQHRPSDRYTGTVRLVASNDESELLPIEKYCIDSIPDGPKHPGKFNRHEICEISRLAVRSEFRRRKADQFKGAATGAINEDSFSVQELRCFPFIAIGLYMSAASMADELGIKHVFVMMEPRLARSMRFVGINFEQLGKAVDYHGIRAPYYISPKDFINNLSPGFRSLYDRIDHDLGDQLAAMEKADLLRGRKVIKTKKKQAQKRKFTFGFTKIRSS